MSTASTPQLAALESYITGWNAASAQWNCEQFPNLYTENALFFGGRPEHSVGRGEIDAYFRSYIGIISSCSLKLRDQHVIVVDSQRFIAQGFGEFEFRLSEGVTTQSVVRTTLIMVLEKGSWKAELWNFAPPPAKPPLGQGDA